MFRRRGRGGFDIVDCGKTSGLEGRGDEVDEAVYCYAGHDVDEKTTFLLAQTALSIQIWARPLAYLVTLSSE